MNKIYKATLLAALGLSGVLSAQAATYNGDLLVGFTTQSGNDLIYDLGSTASLLSGQTWNLTALLTGYNLNAVNWGLIGDANLSGIHTAWSSTEGVTPGSIPSTAAWGKIDTAVKSIYQNFGAAGAGQSLSIDSADDNSWNHQTVSPSLTTQYANVYGNPNVVGLTSASLFSAVGDGSTPSLLGTFSLNSSSVLTYSATPAPEPGTFALIGGGAALLLVFRNKFRRPNSQS